ncbi:SphA family protein [Burkholderia gladioli]|nr:transporter [Burkholderia gladioli]
MRTGIAVAAALSLAAARPACALEGGQSVGDAAFGIDGQSYFALPPPGGLWWINYLGANNSNQIVDNHGNNALPGAKVSTQFNTFRISWMPGLKLFGADWAAFEVFPTYVHSEFRYKGQTTRVSGWGDLAIDPFGLAWKLANGTVGFSTTFAVPTASYDPTRSVNLGRNYATWMPQIFFTHYLEGNKGDFSAHFEYEYHFTNNRGQFSAVNPTGASYKSGQVIHAEIAYSRYLTQRWALAGSVMASHQFTNDQIGDVASNDVLQRVLDGNRYQNVAAGLSIRYLVAGVAPVTLTYDRDLYSRNKAKGQTLVLKGVIPLLGF